MGPAAAVVGKYADDNRASDNSWCWVNVVKGPTLEIHFITYYRINPEPSLQIESSCYYHLSRDSLYPLKEKGDA